MLERRPDRRPRAGAPLCWGVCRGGALSTHSRGVREAVAGLFQVVHRARLGRAPLRPRPWLSTWLPGRRAPGRCRPWSRRWRPSRRLTASQATRAPRRSAGARVRETWKRVSRRVGMAPAQKQPVSAQDLRAMLGGLPQRVLGVRERALIGVGFAGGSRRSELVGLDGADPTFVPEGLGTA